jgi:hypothetical protein
MNRTFTPPLGPAVLERLEAYADRFRPHFNRTRQADWAEIYLHGLLQEGERKSIEPISRRVSLPADLAAVADPEQALQQFMSQSRWEEAAVAREYRAVMADALADPDGAFIVDDTACPKQGHHSVGIEQAVHFIRPLTHQRQGMDAAMGEAAGTGAGAGDLSAAFALALRLPAALSGLSAGCRRFVFLIVAT